MSGYDEMTSLEKCPKCGGIIKIHYGALSENEFTDCPHCDAELEVQVIQSVTIIVKPSAGGSDGKHNNSND